MRVTGHQRLRFAAAELEDGAGEGLDAGDRLAARGLDVEAKRGGDLVVARAAGVDLAADLSEPALDRGVDVLVFRRGLAAGSDLREPRLREPELRLGQETGGVQAPCMDERRLAVVGQELAVVGA